MFLCVPAPARRQTGCLRPLTLAQRDSVWSRDDNLREAQLFMALQEDNATSVAILSGYLNKLLGWTLLCRKEVSCQLIPGYGKVPLQALEMLAYRLPLSQLLCLRSLMH